MTNMKINIEDIIDNLDLTYIHKLSALSDCGDSIYVWSDGSISVFGQGTTPNTDEWYAVLKAWGRGNIDVGSYAEGWAEEERDDDDNHTGSYIEIETGKVMSADEMITECIATGEFNDWEDSVRKDIKNQYDEFNDWKDIKNQYAEGWDDDNYVD